MTRLRHLLLVLTVLPSLLLDSRQRRTFAEMRVFLSHLPEVLAGALPDALAAITPTPLASSFSDGSGTSCEGILRRLADLAALLDRRSPLGLCLRRSLVRYHFLRREGIPLVVQFGARFKDGRPDREVVGHAWLTLEGKPYFEDHENFQGFNVMLRYPSDD